MHYGKLNEALHKGATDGFLFPCTRSTFWYQTKYIGKVITHTNLGQWKTFSRFDVLYTSTSRIQMDKPRQLVEYVELSNRSRGQLTKQSMIRVQKTLNSVHSPTRARMTHPQKSLVRVNKRINNSSTSFCLRSSSCRTDL